ncbi:uncharacterized protein J3D65DRAFT_587458 [Phyllosticta citribraziliensis]|uniref:F-box domain-containing protein n=1 Tax=Phyllosticta citribraziliensis TaxID=989973 RepID=A0ABR1LSP4_9PEZI
MHPAPSDVSPNVPAPATQPQIDPASPQHGLDAPDQPLTPQRSRDAVGGDAGAGAVKSPRLKRSPPPPPPLRNRIDEYANALATTPQRRASGPLFEVIKTSPKSGDNNCAITKLPNEILTHAISHLSPTDLSAVSLVCHRFHALVTTPHAWRSAFARFFLGAQSLVHTADSLGDDEDDVRTERRAFARLTALASWRSEYILRTRLLRSLSRGKPMALPANPRAQVQSPQAFTMYDSNLDSLVNHLHASWGTALNQRTAAFIHGADDLGSASISDPLKAKTGKWGSTDLPLFPQFYERYAGSMWGLGAGNIVGNPNVMDVSQPHGSVLGEGFPGGSIHYRSTKEMRGRFLSLPMELNEPELGIPRLFASLEAVCSVWIAKSPAIPTLTDGLIGILVGSSSGVVSSYSLGTDDPLKEPQFGRGQVTARWVLSPGVPIIALAVDESYSSKRYSQGRVWCTALNALGEVFYLSKLPKTPGSLPRGLDDATLERMSWAIGRTVFWNLVEPSRRVARPNPYRDPKTADPSYSPRSSWDGMCLGEEQVKAETLEMEPYFRLQPKDYRHACLGWDMRRRLEVDFAGDDGNDAGEAVVVIQCGLDEDSRAAVTRYTRLKVPNKRLAFPQKDAAQVTGSLFGDPVRSDAPSPERAASIEEWRTSKLVFTGAKNIEIAATTLDISTYATMTLSEDPIFGFSGSSTASSPFASPLSDKSQPASPADVPGQRARLVAAGTKSGSVFLWDMRAPVGPSAGRVNTVDPIRVIYTDSPEISCLGMTALYLVHGGSDGLVQSWDPLASTMSPIRTLNSRFSSRARRILAQAQASTHGVGINMYAAGAICLDPDPTVLRGVVSLGNHLRCWSYSSSAADAYKSSKRRLRHHERGHNGGGGFSASGRNKLRSYMEREQYEMECEQIQREREAERLAGRFGVDLIDDEEQALAYAALLSEESLADEAKRKRSEASSLESSAVSSAAPTVTPSSSPPMHNDEDVDDDLAEAIRQSLLEAGEASAELPLPRDDVDAFDVPIRVKTRKSSPRAGSSRRSPVEAEADAGPSRDQEAEDLEFALQLSLAEEQSRRDNGDGDEDDGVATGGYEEVDEFPALSPAKEAKGKKRAW